MSPRFEFHGETLLSGSASGPVQVLTEPLSFWGGFDAVSGHVTDRRHPQHGICLSSTILVMAAARGSSSGSSVLAESIRIGTAPAALIVLERDAILLVGALVALELYGLACPIVRVGAEDFQRAGTALKLTIDATQSCAHMTAG
jgi:uncharacterized protein